MKKKVLSLVLALLMTASAASTVLANDDVMAISEDTAVEAVAVDEEVEAGQYDKAIEFLANYKIFKGYNADDTGADDPIERYQMALFVARISTGWVEDEVWEDGPENWSEFSDIDVDPVNKYYGALSYANQKGIIEGYGNGKFGPQDHITYQNALTMVVRTLGYTNLDWPWGYIQKAVELGLTDGITGVAYTDELTRGEVAQIIYNALFATTKSGTTLGLSSFGIEFGWEKIIVTASDLNTFVADKEDAEKKLKDETTPYWDKSNKPASGFVTFQLLNDDGSLADDVYYVQAADLGLTDIHDDEAAVGEAYYVLFEKDEDSNLAKVVAYESLKVDTIWNEGKTDNDGDDQDYAIQEFLDDYALVSKYTGKNYVNVTASTDLEIMVYAANGGLTEQTIDGNLVAIDWVTGDILVPQDQNDDKKITEKDKVDGEYVYAVEWYYNELLGKYWNYRYDAKYENIVGRDWMSEKEFADTYAKYYTYKDHSYKGFAATVDKIATSAYASLEIFDTNLDGVADRGIYESYALGYFTEDKHSDSKSYKISRVDNFGLAENAAKLDDAYSVTGIEIFNEIQEGIKDKDDTDRAWFVEGFEPEVKYDEDGEADGYKAGYVIYNYDAETGAVKVVKCIEDGTDDDSFVKTGVLRAYSITDGTITIGDTTYDIDQYNELEGNAFKYAKESRLTKAIYTKELRALFNQFVKYIVVDGELVGISAVKADKGDELIVVESYAGLSSDGYIVVNGYSTDDLVYDQFRIASYDGWMKGDYYYYLTEKAAAESFTKGAVYKITSYDAEEDVYNVYLAGEFDDDRDNDGNLNFYWVDGYETNRTKLVADDDGYMTKYTSYDKKTGKYGADVDVKMNSEDKYVIISAIPSGIPYASVKVYKGKLPAGAEIEGEVFKKDGGTYVFVNATTNLADTYNTGLVVLLDDTYYSASYNGTDAETWYLLGAAEYTVATVDLFTGDLESVKGATNKKYDEGYVYYTQGDVLTEEEGFKAWFGADIVNEVNGAYLDGDTYFAGQIANVIGTDYYDTEKNSDEIQKNYAAFEAKILADLKAAGHTNGIKGSTKYRGDKVDGVTYRVMEIDEDGLVIDVNDKVGADVKAAALTAFKNKNDYTVLPAFYIYNVEKETVVVYLVVSEATVVTTGKEIIDTDKFTVVELEDAKIVGQIIYTETTTTVGDADPVVVRNILGVRYTFEGEAVEGIHAKILEKGYHFGTKGDHLAEQYTVKYNHKFDGKWLAADETVYGSIVVAEYADCADAKADCDGCELVKAIDVRFKADDVMHVTFTPGTVNGKTVKYYDVDAYTICNAIFANGTPVFYAEVSNTVENWGDAANEKYVDGTAQAGTFETAGMADMIGGTTGVSPDTIVDGIIDILD